jgi:hypothetical protein
VGMHKAPGSRLAKLERLARERPCPACGRTHPPHDPSAPVPDPERLTTEEQDELAELFAAGATPPCVRCGRSEYDLSRMTDDQLTRTLHVAPNAPRATTTGPRTVVTPGPEVRRNGAS